jgi:hypothetical protein
MIAIILIYANNYKKRKDVGLISIFFSGLSNFKPLRGQHCTLITKPQATI